jgi:hypothetical protein
MSKRTFFRLQYQREYQPLLNELREAYGNSSSNLSSISSRGARGLLEEHYGEEGTASPSPEGALDYLLDTAIERFGYSARDVFHAVFDYAWMTEYHKGALVNLKFVDLQEAVLALANNAGASHSISNRVLALSPVDRGPLEPVRWDVDFKSDWVARSVIGLLVEAEDAEIRRLIGILRMVPEARGFAERLLEPFAHRRIVRSTRGVWTLTNMHSNVMDPPQFTLDRDSPVPDNVRFGKAKRKVVKLQAIADLSTCLENKAYYVPDDPNFPLFDAFVVDFDLVKKSAILWILQMTTSRRHGGSALGYQRIREIIAILKNKLQGDSENPLRKKRKTKREQVTPMPVVEVRYILVVPKDGSEFQNLQWQFPKGWNQNLQRNDHRGNVYCLELPVMVCSAIIKKVSSFERIAFRFSECTLESCAFYCP